EPECDNRRSVLASVDAEYAALVMEMIVGFARKRQIVFHRHCRPPVSVGSAASGRNQLLVSASSPLSAPGDRRSKIDFSGSSGRRSCSQLPTPSNNGRDFASE